MATSWAGGIPYNPDKDAGVLSYLYGLAISIEDLEGKRILDVGAGGRYFAADVIEDGIRAKVFSLDPEYERPIRRWHEGLTARELKLIARRSVTGRAEALPFRNSVFDLVLAYRVVQWLLNLAAFEALLTEVVRVLKPGGQARLSPLGMLGKDFREDLHRAQKEIIARLEGVTPQLIGRPGGLFVLSLVKER